MKPAGAEVRITYETDAEVAGGDALVVTRTGRTYLIVDARRMRSRKGPRWALRCIVSDAPAPPGAVVHPLVWWSRDRKVVIL